MPNPRALDGVTVLDATQILAGPFCTMHMSDMGANVIKVEKPGGGDDTRRIGPPFINGESAAFLQLNRNKRSIVLDLRADKGKETFKRLAEKSDILIENGRPGAMDRLGLGYSDISAVNPAIVYCSISGFGLSGPYASRPGFDLIAQGMSGQMAINGEVGGAPLKVGVPIADLNAGMFALHAIEAAYIYRLRTGKGQHVESSLLEAGLAYTVWETAFYFATGEVPPRIGSTHRLIAPYQSFATKDGHMNVGAANQNNWVRLANAIGRSDLLEDSRFDSNASRLENVAALREQLDATFQTKTTAEWLPILDEAGTPAGPIFEMDEVWANEQVLARDMDVVTEHPVAGPVHNIGIAVKMHGTPGSIESAAPTLGQHTDEILEFAGYTPEEIEELTSTGVAGPDAGAKK
jgi:crotonobetainyl-CoA:carnitine CoA-transferase CaiB-like acyl-CoA transferase